MVPSRTVVVAILAAILAGSALGWWAGRNDPGTTAAVVIEVVDGDTIRVRTADGVTDTVRILGVDTPETKHPEKPVECFGSEASAFTEARLLGAEVTLVDDVEPRDIYDRRLASVVIDGGRFEMELLAGGYARLLVIPPNEAHARAGLEAELDARRAGRGLWGVC